MAVANGIRMQAKYKCKDILCQLQQLTFTIVVITLPLKCFDLMLGIQWLSKLSPILWDFDKLYMEFTYQGRKVVLRSARPQTVRLVGNKLFS